MTHAAAQIDVAAVEKYLVGNLKGARGPFTASKFPHGQSNPTFLLESPSGRYVLRRKPPGKLLKSAHAVDREFRVISALQNTDVPVPKAYILCEDEEVIGTIFYVMECVEGRNFENPAVPEVGNEERTAIYDDMNRVLAALHTVDYEAVGLGDFGKPGSYFERQTGRWTQQYRASETETVEDMDNLIAWLERHMPEDDGRTSLVHGDYRIDNMLYRKDEPKVAAVLDWELSTIGHPFSDLGYQCMQWRTPNEGRGRGLKGIDRRSLGIPTEQEYVEMYCRRVGISDIPNWHFYLAFSFFRLAAIIQGVKKRGLDGNASNPEQALQMGEQVQYLASEAMQLVDENE